MFNGYEFDLSGGRAALDFANTLSRTSGDHLPDYAELVSFARQTDQLDEPTAGRLLEDANRRPEVAAAVLTRALALRGAIFRLFVASVRAEAPPPDALEALNLELGLALARARIVPTGGGLAWSWQQAAGLDRPLWPIVRDAADLLTDPEALARVRLCAAQDCDWLFLDLTRNRSRHWCDMKICGNRAKARAYYQRRKATARPRLRMAPDRVSTQEPPLLDKTPDDGL
jgi:predicted RNA-binding Zn ribbon-like protein